MRRSSRRRGLVELPTYAFQRRPYWLRPADGADLGAAGLTSTGHPLLGAMLGVADSDRLVLTWRLSLQAQPWLADHAVLDTVLLPGTAFVELAGRAAEHAGNATIEELTLRAPLMLTAEHAVDLQVWTGSARRPRAALGRGVLPARGRGRRVDLPRHRHRSPTIRSPSRSPPDAQWPPAGAEPAAVGDFYDWLLARGFCYGPAFQGVQDVWRRGDELFAQVTLREEEQKGAARFGVHPALLDAAMHPMVLHLDDGDRQGQAWLPFSWRGVRLHRSGATALRVHLTPDGASSVRVSASDDEGNPVLDAESVACGRCPPTSSAAPRPRRPRSTPPTGSPCRPRPTATAPAPQVLAVEPGDTADAVREAVHGTLAALQESLAGARPLAVVTRPGDLAGAAVWGLVRSAQTEHPDRFVLVEADDDDLVDAAIASGEPQVAVRDGELTVPRLAQARHRPLRTIRCSTRTAPC